MSQPASDGEADDAAASTTPPASGVSDVDAHCLSVLADLKTLVCQRNPVKGAIVCVLADRAGQIISWGFVRSLLVGSRGDRRKKMSGHRTDIHAEADALTALLASGRALGAVAELTVYVSSVTCADCFALIANVGIRRVCYPRPDEGYYSTHRAQMSRLARFHAVQIVEAPPLRPYRPVPEDLLSLLPQLPRAWGKGGDLHVPPMASPPQSAADAPEGEEDEGSAVASAVRAFGDHIF